MRGIITVAMVALCLQVGPVLAANIEVVIQQDASHVLSLDSLESDSAGLALSGSVSRRHFAQRSRPFGSVILNIIDTNGDVLARTETSVKPELISRNGDSEFHVRWDTEIPDGSRLEIAFTR